MNCVSTEILLKDIYRTTYGIFDHVNNKNIALASSIIHEKENVNYNNKLERLFRNYVNKQINEIFKISLLEYLELPSYIASIIDNICSDEINKKSTALKDIESQMSQK